ncbi:GNAT family N-acetyltransferase [Roseomonas sp. KE2513]|uniref:GNAT family N-acetyltransferase n=1 Tax=Roseomonas sp. KE2513 TaxID=2479202 RepID=UPI0018DFA10A|nr:GNAT family N-acetyltransferase [Roseomonas sp. KE2513]MBI0536574.1 GNAT family N-acetyltransferase [Roseomonas sp. KE2513]
MDSFTLRDAAPDDLPAVLRLVRALAEYERLSHRAVATEEDFRALLFGPAPLLHAVLAELGGRVVGGALWYNNVSTFTGKPGIHLEDIFVEPPHRGLGIGRAFFRHLARIAVERGWARLDWQVLDWNEPAIKFYEGLGAEALDEWRGRRVSGDALARLAS